MSVTDDIQINSGPILSMSENEEFDLENVVTILEYHCRICTQMTTEDNTFNIFDPERDIPEKISACLPIIILPTDKYTKFICVNCVEQLDLCYDLITKCLEADKFFKAQFMLDYDNNEYSLSEEMETAEENKDEFKINGPVICDLCGNKKFSDMETFDAHMETLHNASPYQHFELILDGKPCYMCSACKHISESKEEYLSHQGTHTNLICKSCGQFHSTVQALERHTCPNATVTFCEHCNKEFTTRIEMEKHVKEVHQVTWDDQIQSTVQDEEDGLSVEIIHLDEEGGEAFEGQPKTREKRTVTKTKPRRSKDHSANKTNICELCDKVFRNEKEVYRHHYEVHQLPRNECSPFCCRFCNKRMTSKLSLNIHERIHTGQRPYRCDVCGVGFRSKANLIQHQPVHTGIRNHLCTVCGKAFSRKSFVRTHMRVHTGDRPYACDVCYARFTQVGDMRRHKKKHLKNNELSDPKLSLNPLSEIPEQIFSIGESDGEFKLEPSGDDFIAPDDGQDFVVDGQEEGFNNVIEIYIPGENSDQFEKQYLQTRLEL